MRADVRGIRDEPLLQQRNRRERRRARHRIAAERARMRPRRPRHQAAARERHAERHPRRDPFRDRDDVGLDAGEFDGEHLPSAAHSGLHFVDDQQDAVLGRQRPKPLHEFVGRNDVSALALNRFDDDRRHFVGRHEMREQLMFDVVDADGGARLRRRSEWRTVAIRKRRVIHAGQHRAEPAALNRLARRERQRSHRASMKAAEKRDHVVAAGRVARELQACFDRFSAGVAEKRTHAPAHRRDRGELLGQTHLCLVIEIGSRHVQELRRLFGNRFHDRGMRMSGGIDGDTGRAIQEDVPVHVFDHRAFAARDDQRITPGIRGRDDGRISSDDGSSVGTGQCRLEMRSFAF